MEKTTPKPQTHLKHNSTAPSKYLKGTSCTTTKKPRPCHDLWKTQWHLHCVCCGSEGGWCFIFRKKWMYGKSIAKTSNVSQTHLKHTSNAASKYLKRTSNALQQNNAVTLPRPFILLGAVFLVGRKRFMRGRTHAETSSATQNMYFKRTWNTQPKQHIWSCAHARTCWFTVQRCFK